jgi:hypothetical protein
MFEKTPCQKSISEILEGISTILFLAKKLKGLALF